ncbi:Dystrophin- protein 2 [Ataeniobius toweri]|uniref:Dystrophin- protein 2 n=1 Tax=Ataeniobius toweri TaxID=208326 RepID=A0ABU7C2F2_9TELE|nr:Dystrophin- protein 2 [Ataeniobius toweri]
MERKIDRQIDAATVIGTLCRSAVVKREQWRRLAEMENQNCSFFTDSLSPDESLDEDQYLLRHSSPALDHDSPCGQHMLLAHLEHQDKEQLQCTLARLENENRSVAIV